LTSQEQFIGKNPPRFGGTGLIRRFFEKYTQVEGVLSCCVVKMQPDKFTKVAGLEDKYRFDEKYFFKRGDLA